MKGTCMLELLAPAGDRECFNKALLAGADAIYVGGKKYGARAYAGNFSVEELIECMHHAHLLDKKVYLTINTLMKEKELWELTSFLRPLYEEGLDGVIIQDLGGLTLVREMFPGLELHASTQMTVTGVRAATLLKQYGVSRVVPARELSLEEISKIKTETGLELETFIHGAMCYGYSGQCLFSSMLGERSGNRGRCAGPCRLPYALEYEGRRLNGEDEKYLLSLKDLCTLEILPKLIDVGIDSFKIEGRMKSPEYVSFVTGMYRKYIDLYLSDPKEYHVSAKDISLLRNRFSRGDIQSGYYFLHNDRKLVTLDKPGYQSFGTEEIPEETGVQADTTAGGRVELEGYFAAVCGEPVYFTVFPKGCPEKAVTAIGNIAQKALKCAVTTESVKKQLCKTGNTCFTFSEITFEMDSDLFLQNRELNELRREALSQMQELLLDKYKRKFDSGRETHTGEDVYPDSQSGSLRERERPVHIQVRTIYQLQAVKMFPQLQRLYISSDCITSATVNDKPKICSRIKEVRSSCLENGTEFFITLPPVCRLQTMKILAENRNVFCEVNPDGFCVGNLESLLYVMTEFPDASIASNTGLYLFNTKTAEFYEELGLKEHICSYELHRKEIQALCSEKKGNSFYLPVYGYIPVMESAGCVLKTCGACRNGQGEERAVLNDRYRKDRIVITHCDRCENTIYNPVPLSLHKELKEITDMDIEGIVLQFTVESAGETEEAIDSWRRLYLAAVTKESDYQTVLEEISKHDFTKGHFVKGVE